MFNVTLLLWILKTSDNIYKDFKEKPSDYEPIDYEPVDYESVDYEPVDYEPVDYESVDYEPADYEPADYEPVGLSRTAGKYFGLYDQFFCVFLTVKQARANAF